MRALEIGPGKHPVDPRWDMMDMIQRPGITYKHDARIRPWPIKDNQYQLVYMSHVLEHIPWFDTIDTLAEVLRILKPGGFVEIWVPNFELIVDAYLERKCMDNWYKFNPKKDYMTWINGRLFTYGPGEENWHRAAFDEESLKGCLVAAGFRTTVKLDKPRGIDHGLINLGVSGTK